MSVYIVQGKLGTGKGKYVVGKMRDALMQGRRVATNCDLWLENLLPSDSRMTATRVPDKPTEADLLAVGRGYEGPLNEGNNGVLVLDELGSWLNARSFQDKNRAGLLDWLIHARKHRWDVFLIVQSLDMVDKQVRVSIAEYLVKCIRLDKLKIPVIGGFLGKKGTLPRMHVAQISLSDIPGVQVDREFYRNDDLQSGYDTEQIFRDWNRDPNTEQFKTELYVGPFSYLTSWHIKGRFEVITRNVGLLASIFTSYVKPPLKPKLPLISKIAQLEREKAWHYARLMNRLGLV